MARARRPSRMIWETLTPSFLLKTAINFLSLGFGRIVMFSLATSCNVVQGKYYVN